MLTKPSASLAFANTAYTKDNSTITPINHAIVVVGKNVTFDTLFAN
jgi:hypothetical protein